MSGEPKHPDGALKPKRILEGKRREALMLKAVERWQVIRAATKKGRAA